MPQDLEGANPPAAPPESPTEERPSTPNASRFRRVSRYPPVLFFIGGFVWDALTLGRAIKPIDLFILATYLTGAAVILVMLGRRVEFRGSQYLSAGLQFFFGGIFSALFIFYFLSSGGVGGYLFVVGLAALLVGNEFLGNRYSELTLSWLFFTLCSCMFLNFALAHLFRSISTLWFYAGTIAAVLLVLAVQWLSRQELASIKPSLVVAALLLILHAANLIPPVPLVKKQMLIAHGLRKEGATYRAAIEPPGWHFWRTSSMTFHRDGDEPAYCFTSVFVPNGIRTTIRHRWEREDGDGNWETMDLRTFSIQGGREGGFRGYTLKGNLPPGRWRVTAESESGATIAFVEFDAVNGAARKLKRVRL